MVEIGGLCDGKLGLPFIANSLDYIDKTSKEVLRTFRVKVPKPRGVAIRPGPLTRRRCARHYCLQKMLRIFKSATQRHALIKNREVRCTPPDTHPA